MIAVPVNWLKSGDKYARKLPPWWLYWVTKSGQISFIRAYVYYRQLRKWKDSSADIATYINATSLIYANFHTYTQIIACIHSWMHACTHKHMHCILNFVHNFIDTTIRRPRHTHTHTHTHRETDIGLQRNVYALIEAAALTRLSHINVLIFSVDLLSVFGSRVSMLLSVDRTDKTTSGFFMPHLSNRPKILVTFVWWSSLAYCNLIRNILLRKSVWWPGTVWLT